MDIKTEIKPLENAVTSLETEVLSYNDGEMPTTVASEHKINIGRILDLINKDFKSVVYAKLEFNGESADREFSDEKIRVMYSLLSIKWKDKLNNLYILIAKKTKPSIELNDSKITVPAADYSPATSDVTTSHFLREQVHLEKTKPPKFDGPELEFPGFKRKWLSQVSKAGLPAESELDKLRDAVPKQARDMLYGVNLLDDAWKILDHRYGNKDVISRKLKDQLKNIVCEGSNEPEKFMDLKIKVKNIVTRLETMGLQSELKYDREFLSAVYNALPQRYRVKWLDLVKTEDKWSDMLKFLEDTYDKALEEISLLSTINGGGKKVRSFAIETNLIVIPVWMTNFRKLNLLLESVLFARIFIHLRKIWEKMLASCGLAIVLLAARNLGT